MDPIHTLGGASVEISWQEGRLDDKHSKSHQDASSHPEAKIHPEVNVLALADKELHPEVDLHPEGNVLALEDKVHPSASARVRLHKCSEMSATFQKSFVQS